MFKSVTKLANSFKALVYPPTPKRKLVSFAPVKPVKPVDNAAAIKAGRQEVLATLKKVLAKKTSRT